MASFNTFYVVMAFAISFNLLVETSLSSELHQPLQAFSPKINYAPRPLSAYEKYLSNCANKLKPNCGEQIFFAAFVGNETVSSVCCLSLVDNMGKTCHTDMTRYTVNLSMFKPNRNQILKRGEKIWNDCNSMNSFYHWISLAWPFNYKPV